MFELAVFVVAVIAASVASVVGFGIGSLLTPLLALRYDMPLAVALVSVPHAVATALRCWRLRRAVDWAVLGRFGLLSAAGGLSGALVFTRLGGPAVTAALGALLILTAAAGLAGLAARWHPRGAIVWMLGALSGLFGGAVELQPRSCRVRGDRDRHRPAGGRRAHAALRLASRPRDGRRAASGRRRGHRWRVD